VPLTTVMKENPYSICIGNENLSSGRLVKRSRIRVDKIFTVNKNLVVRKIGRLDSPTFDAAVSKLLKIL